VTWLGGGILLILVAAAVALLLQHRPRTSDALFRILVMAGSVLAAIPAVGVLLGVEVPLVSFSTTLPGGPWVGGLDRLSAWFVLLLSVVAVAAVGYGVSYLAKERSHQGVGPAHALFALLLAAMLGVFAARAAVPFLLAWEIMAVSAYLLIVFDHRHPGVRRAGMVYLVMTHAGTLALLGMFLAWGRSSPDLSFAHLTPTAAHLVAGGAPILLLATFGFGIKAGLFPFHFWLPGAHAAAPSHVSALLSGVMIKTGVYGLLRVLVLFGPPPRWWGWTILLLGLASALLGVLSALSQHDLKRALAYSSVDNIGIISMGLGLGSLGNAYGYPMLALLGYTGALLHALNHALFKSLLFLGAGSVARATGTRDLDRLGGLARTMPRTAWAFLIGSLAIVGLPLLNGFVGEWTLVRGFLGAIGRTGPIRMAGLGAAAVGLIGALTLACFIRIGSAVFLGQPRSADVTAADDSPGGMGVGMLLLGAGCLAIGLAPGLIVVPALQVATTFLPGTGGALLGTVGVVSTSGLTVLAVAILLACLAVWSVRHAAGRRSVTRKSVTWACAFPAPTPRMQYTAASFSAPMASAFATSLPPVFDKTGRAANERREDRVLLTIAVPVWQRLRRLATELRPLQQGRVTTYLQYIIGTVLLLLGFLFFAGAGPGT
jgi:hydrogenase-4 component B